MKMVEYSVAGQLNDSAVGAAHEVSFHSQQRVGECHRQIV